MAIAAAHDERAQLSDRYARMKTEQRTLLRSRVAGIRGASKAGVAREAATLISELEAHLALERRENAAHARELNERLYQQEQRQCDMCARRPARGARARACYRAPPPPRASSSRA